MGGGNVFKMNAQKLSNSKLITSYPPEGKLSSPGSLRPKFLPLFPTLTPILFMRVSFPRLRIPENNRKFPGGGRIGQTCPSAPF